MSGRKLFWAHILFHGGLIATVTATIYLSEESGCIQPGGSVSAHEQPTLTHDMLDICRAENSILQKDVNSLRANNNTLAQQNLDMLETENRWCQKLLKRINLDGGK